MGQLIIPDLFRGIIPFVAVDFDHQNNYENEDGGYGTRHHDFQQQLHYPPLNRATHQSSLKNYRKHTQFGISSQLISEANKPWPM